MQTITVDTASGAYPVHIGSGIASEFPSFVLERFKGRKCALITNTTIEGIYSSYIDVLKSELDCAVHTIPDGEKYKTVETWSGIIDALLTFGLDRKSLLIAFGGGVVGDVTGFAAACFMRGIEYVQLPTTLLAMVDSSVGGKTAVDHPLGKNLIGAFRQPSAVWADVNFLETLPRRQFVAGYAEAFKYAFLGGRAMFDFMECNREAVLDGGSDLLLECIERCVRIKAGIVARDEREAGVRALLNFGHTFAHALERFYGFEGLLHGEAVLWGIECAVALAKEIGALPRKHWGEFDEILEGMPLPPLPSAPWIDEIYAAMFTDKKAESGQLRFVMPVAPGEAEAAYAVGEDAVRHVLKEKFAHWLPE
ncbi:3-dehydroquinate synthase [Fibrobacteres bacterium R8-0-B4]